jgi:hypothetical protein
MQNVFFMATHPLLARKIQFFTICTPDGKPLTVPLFNSLISAGFPLQLQII